MGIELVRVQAERRIGIQEPWYPGGKDAFGTEYHQRVEPGRVLLDDIRIVDLSDGTSLGSGPRLTLNLQKGETKVLRVGNDPPSDSDPAVPDARRQGR